MNPYIPVLDFKIHGRRFWADATAIASSTFQRKTNKRFSCSSLNYSEELSDRISEIGSWTLRELSSLRPFSTISILSTSTLFVRSSFSFRTLFLSSKPSVADNRIGEILIQPNHRLHRKYEIKMESWFDITNKLHHSWFNTVNILNLLRRKELSRRMKIRLSEKGALPEYCASLALCPAANITSTGREAKRDQYSYLASAISAWSPA